MRERLTIQFACCMLTENGPTASPLQCASSSSFPAGRSGDGLRKTLPQEEREEFLKTLVLEEAGSLALYRLGPQLIPDTMVREMEEKRLVLLANSIKQETAFRQVFQLFETNGLRYAPIKGIDLAYRIYPSPSLRPFGDWDFLFPRQEMEQVYDCLRKDGWRELFEHSKEAGHHHFPPLVKEWIIPITLMASRGCESTGKEK